jgi:hypothetical protein
MGIGVELAFIDGNSISKYEIDGCIIMEVYL